jgi:hypothetical protein
VATAPKKTTNAPLFILLFFAATKKAEEDIFGF